MTKWLRQIFAHAGLRETDYRLTEQQAMRLAAARARARLEASGCMQVELDAQAEIRERVRAAA